MTHLTFFVHAASALRLLYDDFRVHLTSGKTVEAVYSISTFHTATMQLLIKIHGSRHNLQSSSTSAKDDLITDYAKNIRLDQQSPPLPAGLQTHANPSSCHRGL